MASVSRKSFINQGAAKVSSTIIFRLRCHRPLLLRLAMVLGVLAATPVIGILAVRMNPQYVLIAANVPLLLLGLQVVIQRPYLAPLIILLAATATRWYVSSGITPVLLLTVLFAAVWLMREIMLKRRLGLVRSPVMTPALAFILVAVISLPWGRAMADPLLIEWPRGSQRGSAFEMIQLAQLAVLVLSPVALILTANLISTRRHLKVLVYTYIGFTTIGIFARFLRLPFELNLQGLTSMWAVSLLYGQLLFNQKLSKGLRLAFLAVIGVWLYIRFFLGITWLAGWLPAAISIVVITFLKSRKAFLLLLILVLVLTYVYYDWWQEVWVTEEMESGNRFDKWAFLLQHHVVRGHWLLGTGPFGYALYFMTYFPNNAASTHSNYLDLLLQLGVVGCAVFAWLIGAIAWVGYKLRATPIEDQFVTGFVNSALGGLAGLLAAMFLGDWFIPFVLNQGLHGFSWTVNNWIFLGALVAVPCILSHEQERKKSLEANVEFSNHAGV